MTALEQYAEDMQKSMSSNQLEMKHYFIKLAKALNEDLKALNTTKKEDTKESGTIFFETPLGTLNKRILLNQTWKYYDGNGILLITKIK